MTCYVCNEDKDVRPYGPKGEWICFDCAMTPERKDTTERMFDMQFDAAVAAGDGVITLTENGPVPLSSMPDLQKLVAAGLKNGTLEIMGNLE